MKITIDGKEYSLQDGIIVVGRGREADIGISSGGLSRLHSRFSIEGDSIILEDLGSRNGTWVNGSRIEAAHKLVKGDKVRLADLDCGIVWPQPPEIAPQPDPAATPPAAPSRAEKADRAASRKEKEMIKKLAGAVIIVILVFVGYVYIAGMEPPELQRARDLIDQAEAVLSSAEAGDDLEANLDALRRLDEIKAPLEDIPGEFDREYRQSRELLSSLMAKAEKIRKRNRALQAAVKADRELAEILTARQAGTLSPADAIASLDRLILQYPDSGAAGKVPAEIKAIQDLLVATERGLISRALTEANSQRNQNKFHPAVKTLDAALAHEYKHVSIEESEALRALRAQIIKAGEQQVHASGQQALTEARTGDCEAIKKRLQDQFTLVGFESFRSILDNNLAAIDRIKTERIAAARARLQKELAAIEELETNRAYARAIAGYAALLSRIQERELLREVKRKQALNRLLAAAKAAIMGYVKGEDGINYPGVGEINGMTEEAVAVAMGGMSMPLPWNKIRDNEFLGLLRKALAKSPAPEANAACGWLLLEQDRAGDADPYLKKALASADMRAEYPWLFDALQERLAAAKDAREAAARLAAAERAANKKKYGDPFGQGNVNAVRPLKVFVEPPTVLCLGIRWPLQGDTNRNARCTMQYRRAGEKSWKRALDPLRIDPREMPYNRKPGEMFAGSIFDLIPHTWYEIKLTMTDPDGGGGETMVKSRTRAVPPYAGSIRKIPSGVHKGSLSVSSGASPTKPSIIRGAADGSSILDGNGGTIVMANGLKYLHLENLTFRNARVAIMAEGTTGLVIRRCKFMDVKWAVYNHNTSAPSFDFYISDSEFIGPHEWPKNAILEEEAIQLVGSGHVVCYNKFKGWSDAIGVCDMLGSDYRAHAMDFYNNYITDGTDDAIEADNGEHNIRIFRNFMIDNHEGISTQPVFGGPCYIFRNIIYNTEYAPFKMHNSPSGVLYFHNTSIRAGHALLAYGGANTHMRSHYFYNNLFLGSGTKAFEGSPKMIDVFFANNGFTPGVFRGNGAKDEKRITVNLGIFKDKVEFPVMKERHDKPPSFELKTGNAVDAGRLIRNINEDFTGRAPDLGALEYGQPLPHYGPRRPGVDESTEAEKD